MRRGAGCRTGRRRCNLPGVRSQPGTSHTFRPATSTPTPPAASTTIHRLHSLRTPASGSPCHRCQLDSAAPRLRGDARRAHRRASWLPIRRATRCSHPGRSSGGPARELRRQPRRRHRARVRPRSSRSSSRRDPRDPSRRSCIEPIIVDSARWPRPERLVARRSRLGARSSTPNSADRRRAHPAPTESPRSKCEGEHHDTPPLQSSDGSGLHRERPPHDNCVFEEES